jgi:mono/diheme cytochrome c family protein
MMLQGTSVRKPRLAIPLVVALLLAVAAFGSTVIAQSADLELGRRVYEETAGGVGCAYCHGLTGMGDGTAGVDAPMIQGASESSLRSSLAGAVPLMNFIVLTEPEMQAVLAYLKFLANPAAFEAAAQAQPAPAQAQPGPMSADAVVVDTITINVEISATGFSPSFIEIPVGRRVQLVIRNRTFDEHHFRIVGLVPDELYWVWNEGDEQPVGAAGHEAHDHHAHAHPVSVPGPGEEPQPVVAEDHDHDHGPPVLVPWRATSPNGITPTGTEVHLWAYTYGSGGGRDMVIFTTSTPGTFAIENPRNPAMVGAVRVY